MKIPIRQSAVQGDGKQQACERTMKWDCARSDRGQVTPKKGVVRREKECESALAEATVVGNVDPQRSMGIGVKAKRWW